MTSQTRKRTIVLLSGGALLLCLLGWQVIGADAGNPHANFWRVVRHGIPGFTMVSSQGHKVLITNSGENWREVRNSPIMRGAQVIPGLAIVAMVLFYLLVGRDKLEKPRTGVRIERFSLGERVLHWYTAIMFIIMAITGLSLLLGRLSLIPIFGHPVVSGYLRGAKVLHNYCGPLLLIGILLMVLIWVRYNIPRRADLRWLKNMGGMIGHGPRPATEKINGGEKGWFWLMVVFGIAVGVTGVMLDFPIWGQARFTMQLSHVIHAVAAVLFVTTSFGHIYTGTIGAEGVFEAMWTGSVDTAWAEQHSNLWLEEKRRETGPTLKPDPSQG